MTNFFYYCESIPVLSISHNASCRWLWSNIFNFWRCIRSRVRVWRLTLMSVKSRTSKSGHPGAFDFLPCLLSCWAVLLIPVRYLKDWWSYKWCIVLNKILTWLPSQILMLDLAVLVPSTYDNCCWSHAEFDCCRGYQDSGWEDFADCQVCQQWCRDNAQADHHYMLYRCVHSPPMCDPNLKNKNY